jgi:hypothetical protein
VSRGQRGGSPTVVNLRYDDNCGAMSGMYEWQEKPRHLEETCRIATLATDPA